MKKQIFIYGIRFLILNVFHFYIKIYDQSFDGNIFDYGTRGILFNLYFVVFGMAAWSLGGYIANKIDARFPRKLSFKRRFSILSSVFVVYGILFAIIFSLVYYLADFYAFGIETPWMQNEYFNYDLTFAIMLFFFMILGFNGVFYYTQTIARNEIYTEQLKKEIIQSKYEALKSQIDPHFFFNSLSVLTSLVYKDADLSAEYITKLSNLYRYIIDNRSREIVHINDEVEILDAFMFLIRIRHDNGIRLEYKISEHSKYGCIMPPNSLQLLAENAVKHNKFSKNEPLIMKLVEEEDYLIFSNNYNKRELLEKTSGLGLDNIRKRYKLLFDRDIIVEETASDFIVKLPKINEQDYESFNI
jgi:two-component system, LytTR family, sensor kinase